MVPYANAARYVIGCTLPAGMASRSLRSRSNSYGKNLRLLKGLSLDDEQDTTDNGKSYSEQNRWLFEIAWEVANKGTSIDFTMSDRENKRLYFSLGLQITDFSLSSFPVTKL